MAESSWQNDSREEKMRDSLHLHDSAAIILPNQLRQKGGVAILEDGSLH
jgi:hypothetical protein